MGLVLLTFAFLFLSTVTAFNKEWPFDPTMVALVDQHQKTSFLFRGPAPLSKTNDFVYEKVKERMQALAPDLKDGFYMIDITLLGFRKEGPDIAAEFAFFAKNPSLGKVIHDALYGVNETVLQRACLHEGFSECDNPNVQPRDFDENIVKKISEDNFLDNSSDSLIVRTAFIRNLLLSSPSVISPNISQFVIYYHCECGCDRTGEMTAAYAMRYLNYTFTKIMTIDQNFVGRTLDYENQVASQWFCEWLYYHGLYSSQKNDCGNCKPFNCFPDGSMQRNPSCYRDLLFRK